VVAAVTFPIFQEVSMHFQKLRDHDLRHLWHPYTDPVVFEKEPYRCITRAKGVYLFDQSDRPVYDGICSWWATSLGHSRQELLAALHAQADKMQHSMLGNMSHAPAVELAARLAQWTPGDLNRVYFACDGSSAVEAAMKMALQYWRNIGHAAKSRFIGLEGGYHGDTFGTMSVGYMGWFHQPYGTAVTPALQAPSPACTCCGVGGELGPCAQKALEALDVLLLQHAHEVAALLIEPLCQAAAGMQLYNPAYLAGVRALCDQHNVLLIADEIAVGFGRTGARFACELADIVPDILCIGKALTGGYLPMSAAIARDFIYEAFLGVQPEHRVFWDGHTYCGNPITSAVALAALDVFEALDIPRSCAPRFAQLASAFASLAHLPPVQYSRTLGLIGMCRIRPEAGGAALARQVTQHAWQQGLFIRSLGDIIYLWPPLVSTEEELGTMLQMLEEALRSARLP
jgi:adenosylmethionine-8-amino-7-oxononanoate aminotransferase